MLILARNIAYSARREICKQCTVNGEHYINLKSNKLTKAFYKIKKQQIFNENPTRLSRVKHTVKLCDWSTDSERSRTSTTTSSIETELAMNARTVDALRERAMRSDAFTALLLVSLGGVRKHTHLWHTYGRRISANSWGNAVPARECHL